MRTTGNIEAVFPTGKAHSPWAAVGTTGNLRHVAYADGPEEAIEGLLDWFRSKEEKDAS